MQIEKIKIKGEGEANGVCFMCMCVQKKTFIFSFMLEFCTFTTKVDVHTYLFASDCT